MSKVLSALGGALPDERPLLSLQIAESVAKCPAGYVPVSRTYDEDSDAALLRQNGLFAKKPSHYICLSKSEGVPGYVMDGLVVVGEREPAPAGFSVAGRAGKRRLCTRVSRTAASARAPVTDVIVLSRMRQAPQGFVLAGEINGKVVCYKVSGGSAETSPTHQPNEYENVVSNVTPEANRSSISSKICNDIKMLWNNRLKRPKGPFTISNPLAVMRLGTPPSVDKEMTFLYRGVQDFDKLRAVPERPPKLSPLISEMNKMNLSSAYPRIDDFATGHDYEALSPSYNINKPARPAPRPPSASSPPPRSPPGRHRRKGPAPQPRGTLAGAGGLDGVPFELNPRLRGLPGDTLTHFPIIKKRTRFDLDRDYAYNFHVERQT